MPNESRSGVIKLRPSFCPNSPERVEGVLSEASHSATRCLVGQLDTAVGSHREGRVPRHFPQEALRISEETVAPEEDLLCLLDYRGSRLCSISEYCINLILLGNVVRQRDAREPAVLHIV